MVCIFTSIRPSNDRSVFDFASLFFDPRSRSSTYQYKLCENLFLLVQNFYRKTIVAHVTCMIRRNRVIRVEPAISSPNKVYITVWKQTDHFFERYLGSRYVDAWNGINHFVEKTVTNQRPTIQRTKLNLETGLKKFRTRWLWTSYWLNGYSILCWTQTVTQIGLRILFDLYRTS